MVVILSVDDHSVSKIDGGTMRSRDASGASEVAGKGS